MVITQCPAPKQLRRNWTNVYDPTLACHDSGGEQLSYSNSAASDNDVFNDIAALEDSLIDNYSTNLNGITIMTKATKLTAIADAILKADAKTHTTNNHGHSYFDPLDTLEDTIGVHANFHAQVLSSMAWMVDASCISQARTVLFNRWADADQTTKSFNEFCIDIIEELDHPSLYEDGTPEHHLAQLLALRENWHDAAANAASADDKDYKQRSLREQLESEKPAIANIGTRANYEVIAEREAKGDVAKQARLLDAYIQADTLNNSQRVENNKKLLPTVMLVLQGAMRYKPETIRFDQLPGATQKRLTQFAITTINRIKLDVAKRLANQPIAFGHVIESAYEATEALNTVIAAKYKDDQGDLENIASQSDITHARRQKRVAANTL